MTAGALNITIEQGTTFRKKLTWADDITFPLAGSPIDITGYTARMHIREEVDSTTTELELTTVNGRIILGGANGEIDLLVDDATTAALTLESGVYDLELISGAGVVTRIVEGTYTLSLEVTR